MDALKTIVAEQLKTDLPDFKSGDNGAVHFRVIEGDKERIQIFRGLVVQRQGDGLNSTFTVRKISSGVGVERIFPIHSPRIARIELERRGKVRRAKIYYIRKLRGKAARIEEKR